MMVWASLLVGMVGSCLLCCVIEFEAYRFAEMLFWWRSWEAEMLFFNSDSPVFGLDNHVQGHTLKRWRAISLEVALRGMPTLASAWRGNLRDTNTDTPCS